MRELLDIFSGAIRGLFRIFSDIIRGLFRVLAHLIFSKGGTATNLVAYHSPVKLCIGGANNIACVANATNSKSDF